MLLAVDIGNSSINIGIFSKSILLGETRIPSHPEKTSEIYKNRIKAFLLNNGIKIPVQGVIISSVVPGLTGTLGNSLRGLSRRRPVTVKNSLRTGLIFDVENPEKIGSDRVSNAVAARNIYGPRVLVVDFGTATTISVVKGRRFVGGAILPGIKLQSKILHRDTSKLPYVAVESRTVEPLIPALGKSTDMCILAGILYGTAGATERLIEEMEQKERCKFRVVITGGYSDIMTHYLRRHHQRDPYLTLKGLRLIYERNS